MSHLEARQELSRPSALILEKDCRKKNGAKTRKNESVKSQYEQAECASLT